MTFTQDGRKPWTQHADRLACEIRIWDDGSEDFGQRNSVAKHPTFRPPFLQRSGIRPHGKSSNVARAATSKVFLPIGQQNTGKGRIRWKHSMQSLSSPSVVDTG